MDKRNLSKPPTLKAGDKFGKLTVIGFHHVGTRFRKFYECRCDCGNTGIWHTNTLTSGNTKSCGCLVKESARKRVLPDSNAAFNMTFASYRCHARSKGIPFLLSKGQFRDMASKPCHYCGDPASNCCKNPHQGGDYIYNGIDRVDSTKGYEADNCVPCCKICNIAKKDHSKVEFLDWISRVYEHSVKHAMANQWSAHILGNNQPELF